MREETEVRLPNRSGLVSGEEKSLLRRFAKQIVMSIIASIIAGMILNYTGVKKAVLYAASVVIHLGGDPLTGKGGLIEKAEIKAEEIIHKPRLPHTSLPVIGPVLLPPEEVAARERRKEEERQRKLREERDKLIARAEAIRFETGEDWTLEKLRVEVPKAEQRAREAEERKPLLAIARELRMDVDEDWDNKTLKEEIKEEKAFRKADGDYQEAMRRYREAVERRKDLIARGPNAVCPNPRCRHATRFKPSRIGTQFVCSRCAGIFPVRQAMANWAPPPMPKEPLPPKRKPSLMKRIFG